MTSVIHDIGYQRYQGPRLGRGYAVRSLYVHSLRTGYGLGRSAKAKIFPWLVAGLVGAIAVVVTATRAGTGEVLLTYSDFSDAVSLLTVLFVAVIGPELVSRDLRSGVLPLYFSRPLQRHDYALAKLAAMISAVWLLLAGALVVLFLSGIFTVDGWGDAWDEIVDLAGGLAYAGIHAVVLGTLAIAVASLIGRRAVAAGAVVAVFLVTTPVVGVVEVAGGESGSDLAGLFSPLSLLAGINGWLFGEEPGGYPGSYGWLYGLTTVALVAAAVGLLLLRYRRVQR